MQGWGVSIQRPLVQGRIPRHQIMKPYLMMTMRFMTMLWQAQTKVSRVLLPQRARLAAWVSAHKWRSTMLRSLGQTQIPLQTVAAVTVIVMQMADQTKPPATNAYQEGTRLMYPSQQLPQMRPMMWTRDSQWL